uniref:HTH cro/C1-type domain-containing protein n=1 Tax=viral metagenome TaxID=1070528 RepID=A0A6C0D176_9ZZZZ
MQFQDWETVVLKKSDIKTGESYKKQETQVKDKDKVTLKEPSLDFQKALQQARMANKMSQKDLALKLGMNLNTMVNYEKGKEVPTNLIISKLEKLLNTKLPRIQKKVFE